MQNIDLRRLSGIILSVIAVEVGIALPITKVSGELRHKKG